MAVINVRIPDSKEEAVQEAAERSGYTNRSEWVREAIREKLERDTALYPEEVERILEIWQREEQDEAEWIPAERMWEKLGLDEDEAGV